MRLTRNLKAKIIEQFKSGASMDEISLWYDQRFPRIEQVLREALVAQEKLDRPAASGAELVQAGGQ